MASTDAEPVIKLLDSYLEPTFEIGEVILTLELQGDVVSPTCINTPVEGAEVCPQLVHIADIRVLCLGETVIEVPV